MIATSIEQIPNISCFDDSPRGRLLRGAAYLFHKQGYDKTTVRELAQFIGIQSGSLFHHFKSKDDILAHVMEETIIYNLARLEEAAHQSNDPEQQLRALIKAELISITGDTGAAMAVLVYEWFALSKEKQNYLLKMRNEYEQIWLDVIENLRTQGKVKHDAFIWRRLIGGAISWTVTWYKSEGKVKIDELTEMVLEMALK
ncbi:TetR/AcrR family transcriptional regulator [Acinetobacter nosocomialis]|uniref:TetR/AcrR family transcriptional regulator n=1 Tax=Acinetobacter TaxID=469 RepID=UPI000450A5BC|nr:MULTISPECIES: TetR/AcrR family transcriptional regulator [Acinetobacter]KCY46975.1 bacterial regulatory s, tetR family protein [Acinetobacter baumannii 1571545]EXB66304.1 bacterial regulatory s, tetR family protein [Acinetobacter sp. 21871]EXR59469.1 bacterial regulatory s, tetR family protein [Acinetobacter sp. 1424608]MBD8353569.1 TetR family transcriptional regulator [Acinetobacter nosocomialis]MBJ8495914.1 TetR family transcriptional regulator [Acinetobacter nosocomialis]